MGYKVCYDTPSIGKCVSAHFFLHRAESPATIWSSGVAKLEIRWDSEAMEPRRSDANRAWLSGLAVMIAAAVAYAGFATVSVKWTIIVSTMILVGLVTFLWWAGGGKHGS